MGKCFLIIFFVLAPTLAWSYPNFISHGYQSCLTCHYNPLGNGPLTDYGRAVSATGIAGRLFVPANVTEEDLANRSGFFLKQPTNSWLRPSLAYRGMYLKRNMNQDTKPDPQFIHMQNDVNLVAKWGSREQYVASFTYGFVPSNSTTDHQTQKLSREQYVGYRWNKEMGLYLGKMDKAFGIRVPDHTAFSRLTARATQNAQTHGLTYHWGRPDFDLGLQYFLGDFDIKRDLRSSGFTGTFEKTVFDSIRLGASFMREKYTTWQNQVMAVHSRIPIGLGSSIMVEMGQQDKKVLSTQEKTLARYVFLQNHLRLARGLYYITTLEYYNPNNKGTIETYRIAPGIQYFPQQRIEIRFDLYNTRTFSDTSVPQDSLDFAGQVHLWI